MSVAEKESVENLNIVQKLTFTKLCNEVKTIWESYGADELLMQKLEYLNKSRFIWTVEDNKIWLIYIDCLLKRNDIEKAKHLLKKYIMKFGTKDIDLFLNVSIFANAEGCLTAQGEQIKEIDEYFERNKLRDKLINICKDKTIAVVGNSPCEFNKKHGEEIDGHDVVIRFNNYKISGFEEDYGTKTNIWFKSLGNDIDDKGDLFDLIIYSVDFNNYMFINDHVNFISEKIKNQIPQVYFPQDLRDEISDVSCIDWPLSGTMIIYALYKYVGLSNVDFYGFNFINSHPDSYSTHYFSDSTDEERITRSRAHNYLTEDQWLKELTGKI